MQKLKSPFSKAQLLPKEERLEISSESSSLVIGIPRERSFQEKRICLTPDAVSALTNNGHRVLIESGAGHNAAFEDKEYSEAGAEITNDTAKVFSSPIILKVEPPTLNEIKMIKPNTVLISALQLKMQTEAYFEALSKKKILSLIHI